MKTIFAVIFFTMLLFPAAAQLPDGVASTVSAGTVTWQWGNSLYNRPTIQTSFKASWTAKTVGPGTGTATVVLSGIYGTVTRITWIPGTGGDQPDADYDCTIKDVDAWDVAQSQGVDLSQTASESYVLSPGVPVMGDLTFAITNAGAGNKGTIRVYLLR